MKLTIKILICRKEPVSLIPIAVITTVLGGLVGFSIQKIPMENKF